MSKKKKNILPKKDKTLFSIVCVIPFLIICLILFNYDKISFFCANLFSSEQYYFSELKFNFFTVMIFALLAVEAVSILIYLEKALGLKISFGEYYSGKSKKANKQIKSFVIYSVLILILCISSFCMAGQSRISADDEGIKSFNITKSDETLFTYNSITKAEVYVEYDSGIWTGRHRINNGYNAVITVSDNDNSYTLYADGFNNNYINIEKFINKLDPNIVTIDNTYADKIVKFSSEQKNAVNRIFRI